MARPDRERPPSGDRWVMLELSTEEEDEENQPLGDDGIEVTVTAQGEGADGGGQGGDGGGAGGGPGNGDAESGGPRRRRSWRYQQLRGSAGLIFLAGFVSGAVFFLVMLAVLKGLGVVGAIAAAVAGGWKLVMRRGA